MRYIWGNNGLAAIITGDTTVVPIYDNDGEAVGFFVEKTEEYTPAIPDVVTQKVYTYVKNLQGDVIRILDENGNTVVSYTYDPWGVPTVTGDADLAALNPCSYRGYDYDEETGLYYLQSRYYDPEIGRFLNADYIAFLGAPDSIVGNNLFAYCQNDSINSSDPTGFISKAAAVASFAYEYGIYLSGAALLTKISAFLSSIAPYLIPVIAAVVTAYVVYAVVQQAKVSAIAKKIPSRLKKGEKQVDLDKFNKKKKNSSKKEEDGGWYIDKDRAGANSHGGSYWKLFDNKGNRIATLDILGNILRG